MAGHKQIEQALKRPDNFQDNILRAIAYVKENKQRAFMIMSPLLAVCIVGYAVFSWSSRQAANRRGEVSKIGAVQAKEVASLDKARADLQKQIDDLRATKPSADGKKTELSAEDLVTVTKLELQISTLKPDKSKSTAEYKKFYDANTLNQEGWMAGLSWAGVQLEEGKAADARTVAEAISKASTSNNFYQTVSRMMLIGIMEDASEFDAAIKESDVIISLASDETKPMALLAKGRLQYFKKSFPEARLALKELIEKFATSSEASTARSLIAAMGPA